MSQFTYKDCVFEVEIENKGRNKCEFYGKLSLVSVAGKVLEIPNTYEGKLVNFVYVSDSDSVAGSNNLFEYCEVGSTDSSFSSIEEIRIPASLQGMIVNRHIFPNLNKVIVDSKNKHFRIIDEQLLCTSDDSLIAYCGNEELDECVIPEGIKRIGIGAFAYTKIHKINFPSSIALVELHCVDHSIFLQDLGDVVEFAGSIHALKKDVDELVITDFKKLGREIFRYGLPKKIVFDVETIINFPSGLTFKEVDTIEFRNSKIFISDVCTFCRNFQHLIVNPASVNYCVIDDVLFSKDKTQLLLYPGLKEAAEYVVPEGTLEIGSSAFKSNLFCKSIQLPTTLRKLCKNFMVGMHSLQNLSTPKSVCAFRFENIWHSTMEHFEIPRSIRVLDSNSICMQGAVVDATEVEYFMEDSVFCKKLILGDKVKYVARGAFCSVESLKTPELKLYKFIEAFFPPDDIAYSDQRLKYVEITRQDSFALNLAFPILKDAKYQQSIFSSWGEDGIRIERYADSLVQIKNAEVKYKAIIYCLEHNNGKLVEELLPRIGRIAKGLISCAIKQESFATATLLYKSGIVKPTLAKELLKGELPNVLVPVVMSILEDKKQAVRLSL